jgi:alpha-amylase/alpha-mannosidase (GH57 family)
VIHGHFYQPPRENPVTGTVAEQPTAAPFHDWNERVARECYSPNSRARLLSQNGLISRVINNYQHMSFNVGPTLMAWLVEKAPETARLIVKADQDGAIEHNGHGPAMAQAFNHVIMPLANRRDKLTQIVWGREHFKKTFGRQPEGMWLAETAADTETLSLLSKSGIKFTVLAQGQIDAVRPVTQDRSAPWEKAETPPDPREPYRVYWGRGPHDYINAFVYDGPVSRSVAFESLLRDGQAFLGRIEGAFGQAREDAWPRLVNLATDGESYGHHFQFGEMALAWLVDQLERVRQKSEDSIVMTNYAEFLAKFPPRLEGRLVENSSWSCSHGIERWRSDCGCHAGGQAGWNQKWRVPLRDGLNWLRERLANIFESALGPLLKDPWEARDDYVSVLASDFEPSEKESFLARHAKGHLSQADRLAVWEQLEAQLMGQYMFTSCGWFFDDITGLEPVQNLRYAHRAINLANKRCEMDLSEGLLSYLRQAKPNDPDYPSGEEVWKRLVVPHYLSDSSLCAHWAAARLMGVTESLDQFKYQKFAEPSAETASEAQVAQLDLEHSRVTLGRVLLCDPRQGTTERVCLATCPAGGESLSILVARNKAGHSFPAGKVLLKARENPALLADPKTFLNGLLDPGAPIETFSLEDLYPSVRQTILTDLVSDFFRDLKSYTEKSFNLCSDILVKYSSSHSRLDWLSRFVFRVVTEAKFESFLGKMKNGERINLHKLAELVNEKETAGSFHNEPVLTQAAQDYLASLLGQARDHGARPSVIQEALDFINFLKQNHLRVDFWEHQNIWHSLGTDSNFLDGLDQGRRQAFMELGKALNFESPLL